MVDYDYSLHYSFYHDDSDEHAAQMAAIHKNQLQPLLPADKNVAVLDIGCGMGFALLALRDMGIKNVMGIDRDPAQVQKCRRRDLSVCLEKDAGAFLAEHPQEFDVVLMLDVLEHVPVNDQIDLVRAVHTGLKSMGRLILTVPNANSLLAARWRYIDFTHHSSFTEKSLHFVLKNAGFDRTQIVGYRPMLRPSLRLWRREARIGLVGWLARHVWRMVLTAEIGPFENMDDISLDLNLTAVALKA